MQKHLLHHERDAGQEAHSGWGHAAWILVLLVLLAVLGPCSRTAGGLPRADLAEGDRFTTYQGPPRLAQPKLSPRPQDTQVSV
jgi:hypothetical protein